MARKKAAINKSQAIRDYDAKHKGAKPAAVVEALKKQGIEVTAQQVSTTRFNAKKGKKRDKRVAAKNAAAGASEKVSVEDLIRARDRKSIWRDGRSSNPARSTRQARRLEAAFVLLLQCG